MEFRPFTAASDPNRLEKHGNWRTGTVVGIVLSGGSTMSDLVSTGTWRRVFDFLHRKSIPQIKQPHRRTVLPPSELI